MKMKFFFLFLVGCIAGPVSFSNAVETTSANKQLWMAALDGSLNGVIAALKEGGDANAPSRHGMTLLMWAAQTGNLSIAKLLIKNGAEVNAVHPLGGCTAVGFSAQHLQPEIMQELFDHGAKIKQAEKNKWTPLLKAARTQIKPGDEKEKEHLLNVVKILIKNGGDVNARSKKQATPLILAAQNNNLNIMGILLDNGARINDTDKEDSTALMYAAEKGYREIFDLLLGKGADIEKKHILGHTALLLASERGHTGIVAALLAKGSDVHAKDEDGTTALMFASAKGYLTTAELLLKQGARVDDMNNNGKTARMIAVENEQDEVEQLLHQWGGHCF